MQHHQASNSLRIKEPYHASESTLKGVSRSNVLDKRSATRIWEVMLKTPPCRYIFSLFRHPISMLSNVKPDPANLVPTLITSVLTTLSPLAMGDWLTAACSAKAVEAQPNCAHTVSACGTNLLQSIHFHSHPRQQPRSDCCPPHRRRGGNL